MKLFLALILAAAPFLAHAQTSIKNANRGTFSPALVRQGEEELRSAEEERQQQLQQQRQPSTLTGAPVIARPVYKLPRDSALFNTQPQPQPRPQVQPPPYHETIVIIPGAEPFRRGSENFEGMPARGWAREALGLNNVNLTGAGVKIALLDSGVSPNYELNGKVSVRDETGAGNPSDQSGHGTAIAGIMVGGSGRKFKSVAPDARIESFKVTFQEKDSDGKIRTKTNNIYLGEAVLTVLEYNRQYPDSRIDIINISYGLKKHDKYLEDTLRRAYNEGITIVAAGGNKEDEKPGACPVMNPAAADFIIGAGAITSEKKVAEFSCAGPGLNFVAPGQDVFSLDNKNRYDWWSGTSYSAAYITGISALIIQAWQAKHGVKPSPRQVFDALKKISAPLPDTPAHSQGYGLPDASKIKDAV